MEHVRIKFEKKILITQDINILDVEFMIKVGENELFLAKFVI